MLEFGVVSERVLEDTTAYHELTTSLESDIHDIHDTFCMMNTMISTQQPTLDTLESEIESTSVRTQATVQELKRADTYHTKTRRTLFTFGIVGSVLLSLPVVALAGVPAAIATTTLVGGGACILGRKLFKESPMKVYEKTL